MIEIFISVLPSLYLKAHPKNLLSPNFLSAPNVNPLVLISFALFSSSPKILKDMSPKLQLDHFDFLFLDLCLLINEAMLFLIDGSNLLAKVLTKDQIIYIKIMSR